MKASWIHLIAVCVLSLSPILGGADLAEELSDRLVTVQGRNLTQADLDLSDAKYFVFYYSAEWCPPCRAFTPDLVRAYRRAKQRFPDFELIFVSSDRSEADMANYMSGYRMPWPALAYDQRDAIPTINENRGRGIPGLAVVDAQGNTVISSHMGEERIGARGALEKFERLLREQSGQGTASGGSQADFDSFFGN